MSELPPGSMSLEEEPASFIPPPEPPAPEPPAQGATPPAEEPEPEGTVEIPTGKVVPLAALQETRGKVRDLTTALSAKDQEIEQLRQKAARADQIAEEWQRVKPLIEQARQHVQQPAAPAPPPKGPLSDAEAIEYARTLDLFKADGTPDVDRAQKLAAMNDSLADRRAQAAVQPLQEKSAAQQSFGLFEQYANLADKAGQKVPRAILQRVWSMVPPNVSANPDVANVLHRVALAEAVMQGQYRGTVAPLAPPPPPHTEGLGGGQPGKVELSGVERSVMSAAGMGEKQYTEISGRFKPGQHNVLE